ncbi:hypothetical protein [Thermodesulfovibrio hydrogeniphilus]
MSKAVLLLVGLFVIFGAFYAEAGEKDTLGTVVSITLEDRKAFEPDTLIMNLQIKANTSTEAEAINIFGSIDKAIRSLNVDYTGGKYSVAKYCWWEKERKRCAGYKGELNYVFKLKDLSEQSKIFEAVEKFKDKYGEKINYAVSEPYWTISKEQVRAVEEELRYSIIDSAKNFAKKVSEKLEKSCSISRINYDIDRSRWWGWWRDELNLFSAGLKYEKMETPEPKKEDRTVSIKASVDLQCK